MQAMVTKYGIDRRSARGTHFTELDSSWKIPLSEEVTHICDIATSFGKSYINTNSYNPYSVIMCSGCEFRSAAMISKHLIYVKCRTNCLSE